MNVNEGTPARQSEIPVEMSKLDSIISELEALSGELKNRLSPLCRDESPPGPASVNKEVPFATKLGGDLRQCSSNVSSSVSRLKEILNTLEL